MAGLGVEFLVAHRFDLAFAQKSAEDFVRELLVEGLGVQHVVVGYDFVFGNKRRGNAALLRDLGAARGFSRQRRRPGGEPQRRGLCLDPDPRASGRRPPARGGGAARPAVGDRRPGAHGRPARPHHRLSHRQSRSRRLSAPGGRRLCGARRPRGARRARAGTTAPPISAGGRPSAARICGSRRISSISPATSTASALRVAFIEHLRPEQRFAGLDALKAQIAADCARARVLLARERAW